MGLSPGRGLVGSPGLIGPAGTVVLFGCDDVCELGELSAPASDIGADSMFTLPPDDGAGDSALMAAGMGACWVGLDASAAFFRLGSERDPDAFNFLELLRLSRNAMTARSVSSSSLVFFRPRSNTGNSSTSMSSSYSEPDVSFAPTFGTVSCFLGGRFNGAGGIFRKAGNLSLVLLTGVASVNEIGGGYTGLCNMARLAAKLPGDTAPVVPEPGVDNEGLSTLPCGALMPKPVV